MISKESFTGNDRGVSPVIGVILMVAVTVVLAAVIGASVLDVGEDVGESPSAAVEYDGGDSMTILSVQNADSITVTDGEDVDVTEDPAEAGATISWDEADAPAEGDQLTVTATVGGDSQVIQTFEYEAPA